MALPRKFRICNDTYMMDICFFFNRYKQSMFIVFVMLTMIRRKKMISNKRATPRWVTKSCDNRYDEVCGWKSIQDMASCLLFKPFLGRFDLDLWPYPKVKVISTWVIECALLGCTLVPRIKSVGEIAFEIWPVFWFFTHF